MRFPTPNLHDDSYAGMRVALCQIETERWELDGNFARTLEALKTAKERGADLAVTPECVLHGYAEANTPEDQARLRDAAEPIDGSRITEIRETCARLNLHCVLGFAELGADQKIYNSAAFIDATGELRFVYRKVHCRPAESIDHEGGFTAGSEFHVTPVQIGEHTYQLGTMICFDREIPETTRCLRALGAELVLCPLAADTNRLDQLPADQADNELITRARAAENEQFIVVVNHAKRYNGGSFIIGPAGEVITQMDSDPGVEVVTLPWEIIAKRFHSSPHGWMGWGYRRAEVYRKYYIQ